MAINKQLPTEVGTIVEKTSEPQIYAPPDYSGANAAGLLGGGRDEDRLDRSSLGRASFTMSGRPPNSLPGAPIFRA